MSLEGGCACGDVRYKLTEAPMIVHACHCRDCQRLTGSAFALNMWIERKFVETTGETIVARQTAGSGKPHEIFSCPRCGTALWSKYHAAPGDTLLVRAGTLDDPAAVKPDVHIFTRSKVPWLELPNGARSFPAFYKIEDVWPAASLARWKDVVASRP